MTPDWKLAKEYELEYKPEGMAAVHRPAELWRHPGGLRACVVTERMGDPGKSITNAAELIAKAIRNRHGNGVLQIEHYIYAEDQSHSLVVTYKGSNPYRKHIASGDDDLTMTEMLDSAVRVAYDEGIAEDGNELGRLVGTLASQIIRDDIAEQIATMNDEEANGGTR